jgi:hypothetical protein
MVAVLKREGELNIRPETERLLLRLSPATIDRLLKTHRPKPLRGRGTTKPGTLLKGQIPVRTFADWDDARPGFLEVDLVAHCGESTKGEYLHTLTAVDIDTRWCELSVLPNRGQQAVKDAIEMMRGRLPFPLLGLDSGSDAFLNWNLTRYCQTQKITFTRCRPYRTTRPTWSRRTGQRYGSWWDTIGTLAGKPRRFWRSSTPTGGCS